MMKLEDVVQGLARCTDSKETVFCSPECPYYNKRGCREVLERDALELLKAYKSKESEWVKMTGMMIPELHGYHMCKNCEWHEDYHNRETLYPYCPACGAKMKNGIKHGC